MRDRQKSAAGRRDAGPGPGPEAEEPVSAAVLRYGGDILRSGGMERSKGLPHHGGISVYDHSLRVAACCLRLARKWRLRVDERSLVRGALLHDYYLYDWHIPDGTHKWHGFIHAKRALGNAERDFCLNDVERDMIRSHMFPLNPRPPRYRESRLLTLADKICSVQELASPASRRSGAH